VIIDFLWASGFAGVTRSVHVTWQAWYWVGFVLSLVER